MAAQKQMPASASPKEASERTATSETAQPEAAQGIGGSSALSGPPLLRPTNLLGLQRSVGNQAVQRMLKRNTPHTPQKRLIQRTLKVGVENQESYDNPQTLLNVVIEKGEGKYNNYKLLVLESLTSWINEHKTFDDWTKLLEEVDKIIKTPGKSYIEMGNQMYTLIGTQHTPDDLDRSGRAIPMRNPANSAMILEYTPLTNSGRNAFNQEDVSKVKDNTQKPMAEYAIENRNSGLQMIGGDGRKAFDNLGNRHSLSLRNKELEDYDISSEDLIDTQEVSSLFDAYADIAFQANQDPTSAIEGITQLVTYHDGTNQTLVLNQTINRLRALTQSLGDTKTSAIVNKAKQTLTSSLSNIQQDYEADIQKADEMTEKYTNESIQLFESIMQINIRNTQIQEELNKMISDSPQSNEIPQPNPQKESLQEELSQNSAKLFDLQNEFDFAQNYNSNYMKSESLKKSNQDIISSLHDAICNLLLFAEVLAVNKPNVVVGFGAEHIVPLRQLIEELKAADENNV